MKRLEELCKVEGNRFYRLLIRYSPLFGARLKMGFLDNGVGSQPRPDLASQAMILIIPARLDRHLFVHVQNSHGIWSNH